MKKIYLTLLLSIFSLTLFCQQENKMVLDSSYGYGWDSETNDWILEGRLVYTHDSNGNQTEKIWYTWDYDNTIWNARSGNFFGRPFIGRYIYQYDSFGNKIEEIRYFWNEDTNEWVRKLRCVYTYDANGNYIDLFMYWLDSDTNEWSMDCALGLYT